MGYWWVNHKQTHRQEINGGYIWSPKTNIDGSRNQTYINLTRTRVGDVIFSYAYAKIRAIGIVEQEFCNADRPSAFGKTGEQWEKDGWLVHVDWSVLDQPISPKPHIAQIAPLLPEKNSPLQPNGNGNQVCYLAEISAELGKLLLGFAQSDNEGLGDALDDLSNAISDSIEENRIRTAHIPETEKEQLVKARRGQGLFRRRLEEIESACRLTGIRDKHFLIASHIKPWRRSDNGEKLDGNNGLLLSPHVDMLFDRGWITFADDGRVLCANEAAREIMKRWGLDLNRSVGEFNEKQKYYLAYHRKHIYRA